MVRHDFCPGKILGHEIVNHSTCGHYFGGQSYQRPENLGIIGDTLFVAVTEGPRDEKNKGFYEGRVIAMDLKTMTVGNFIKLGVNVPVVIGKPSEEDHQADWDSVDNLAETPDGKLVIIEDNKPSDIWIATTKTTSLVPLKVSGILVR